MYIVRAGEDSLFLFERDDNKYTETGENGARREQKFSLKGSILLIPSYKCVNFAACDVEEYTFSFRDIRRIIVADSSLFQF